MHSAVASFQNLHLNMRVSASNAFMEMGVWRACGDPIDIEALKHVPVNCGLDLSETQDLSAFVITGVIDGKTHVYPIQWLPEHGLYERSIRDRASWDLWHRQGFLELSPGKTINYDHLARYLRDNVFSQFDINYVAYDPHNFSFFQDALLRAGVTQQYIDTHFKSFRQGFISMSSPIAALEAMVLEKKLAHANHPVLTKCVANAIVLHDSSGNRKLDKSSYLGRVDSLIGLVMAIGVTPLAKPRTFDIDTLLAGIPGSTETSDPMRRVLGPPPYGRRHPYN
jgi:phage terminase large subunit-like protein